MYPRALYFVLPSSRWMHTQYADCSEPHIEVPKLPSTAQQADTADSVAPTHVICLCSLFNALLNRLLNMHNK